MNDRSLPTCAARRRPSLITAACLAAVLTGCDTLNEVNQNLDGAADATYWFWVRLQGIQYRQNPEIVRAGERNASAVQSGELDTVGDGFASVSRLHAQAARQLKALDAEKVDALARDYRDRLVAAHEALAEEYAAHASATKERRVEEIEARRAQLRQLLTGYVQAWNDRQGVMDRLQEKFSRGFDYVE